MGCGGGRDFQSGGCKGPEAGLSNTEQGRTSEDAFVAGASEQGERAGGEVSTGSRWGQVTQGLGTVRRNQIEFLNILKRKPNLQ